MNVSQLGATGLQSRLEGPGLRLRTGPVVTRIRSRIAAVAQGIGLHYARHTVEDEQSFCDFHVAVERPASLRRWMNPQVIFRFDDDAPFAPLPGDQGFPMLEWGMNWCITSHCHQYLILHAAVLERGGRALILPAPPGSGKSTLCAGLVFRGWRLLSDELAVIDPATGRVLPVPRPISLKNASIEVIRHFAPEAAFSPVVRETVKGAVAHCRPPAADVHRADEQALPGWVVLPRYEAGAATQLRRLPKSRAVVHLVENAFNFNVHGRRGFELLADLADRCDCFEFTYSRLDEAAALFGGMADRGSAPP